MRKFNMLLPMLLTIASFVFMAIVRTMDSFWEITQTETVSSVIFIATVSVLFFSLAYNTFENYDKFLKKAVKVLFLIIAFALSILSLIFSVLVVIVTESLAINIYVFAFVGMWIFVSVSYFVLYKLLLRFKWNWLLPFTCIFSLVFSYGLALLIGFLANLFSVVFSKENFVHTMDVGLVLGYFYGLYKIWPENAVVSGPSYYYQKIKPGEWTCWQIASDIKTCIKNSRKSWYGHGSYRIEFSMPWISVVTGQVTVSGGTTTTIYYENKLSQDALKKIEDKTPVFADDELGSYAEEILSAYGLDWEVKASGYSEHIEIR